jgi:glutamate-ammonia-ligase adenylyltransferase
MRKDWIDTKADETIDPVRVRVALHSLEDAWPNDFPPLRKLIEQMPVGEEKLLALLAVSPISAEKLIRDPAALLWLAEPGVCNADRGAGRMIADVHREKTAEFDPSFRALRMLKGRELLRIALREVGGLSTLEQTTLELTRLAEVCLREVEAGWFSDFCRRWGKPKTEFAILGMGKFGGEELNYSSDIDVIFFYGEEGSLNGNFTHHEFFTRLAEKIAATFAAKDEAGALFRIDLRLRPEGADGPLVRSLESMENYYAGFGETWERMAMIKARGVAGSEELAYEFCQRLQSFMYPRALSPDLLEEIASVKSRIEREIVGEEKMTRNVKLGYGGIREIEFVAQSLQLIHGARHAFLQERNTLKTLRGLQQLNIIPREEMADLADACRFLRTVEHRLQIEGEQQTHTIPEDAKAVSRLAASLGFATKAKFERKLGVHTRKVRAIFNRILHGERPEMTTATLDLAFFSEPQAAARTIRDLREGGAEAHISPRTKRIFDKLEPLLVQSLRDVADPDLALNRFVRFVARYGIRGLLFETLVVNPKLLELLVKLFDSSRFITDIVLRRPQLIEEIARDGLGESLGVAQYAEGVRKNPENLSWMDAVRVYRRSQILRIFLRDVLGLAKIEEVQAEYSALAEACLVFVQASLGIGDALTVIAMGKFGGSELSYGCDLDVMFVGDDVKAAAQLVKAMTATTEEGIVFPMDARLRPEGEAGQLMLPLASYAKYYEGRAQLWEVQALTKARPVSGPMRNKFLELAQKVWRKSGKESRVLSDIKSMHDRVVKERTSGDELLDFKTGAGGLMQLEFFVQGSQMKRDLWENNTVRAIGRLAEQRIVSAENAEALSRHYLFLRKCESVLRRDENSGVSSLPPDEEAQRRLALRCGFADRAAFLAAYQSAREGIRQAARL